MNILYIGSDVSWFKTILNAGHKIHAVITDEPISVTPLYQIHPVIFKSVYPIRSFRAVRKISKKILDQLLRNFLFIIFKRDHVSIRRSEGLRRYAKKIFIPVFAYQDMRRPEIFSSFNGKIDVVLSAAAPVKIPMHIINLADKLAFNIHAGKLPAYRGAQTVFWAVKNGEKNITVSALKLAPELDTGDILIEKNIFISEENILLGKTYKIINEASKELLLEILSRLKNNSLAYTPQNPETKPRFYPYPLEENLRIHWNETAESLRNLFLASLCYQFNPFCFYKGKKILFDAIDVYSSPQRLSNIPGTVVKKGKDGWLVIQTADYCIKGKVKPEDENISPRNFIHNLFVPCRFE